MIRRADSSKVVRCDMLDGCACREARGRLLVLFLSRLAAYALLLERSSCVVVISLKGGIGGLPRQSVQKTLSRTPAQLVTLRCDWLRPRGGSNGWKVW